jgi:hypothetical protein
LRGAGFGRLVCGLVVGLLLWWLAAAVWLAAVCGRCLRQLHN